MYIDWSGKYSIFEYHNKVKEYYPLRNIVNSQINFYKWFTNNGKLDDLRSEEISHLASQISQSTQVRKSLVNFQRNFANNPPKGKGSVIDGRDIGTIIIPNA